MDVVLGQGRACLVADDKCVGVVAFHLEGAELIDAAAFAVGGVSFGLVIWVADEGAVELGFAEVGDVDAAAVLIAVVFQHCARDHVGDAVFVHVHAAAV